MNYFSPLPLLAQKKLDNAAEKIYKENPVGNLQGGAHMSLNSRLRLKPVSPDRRGGIPCRLFFMIFELDVATMARAIGLQSEIMTKGKPAIGAATPAGSL